MKFNTEQFKCCRDDKLVDASLHRLNDSIRYQGCCGSNTFDEEKSWCDDRTEPPVVKSKHIAVCNGTDYDDRTHVCCHDEYGKVPAGGRSGNDGVPTSMRRYDVASTLVQRHYDVTSIFSLAEAYLEELPSPADYVVTPLGQFLESGV